MTEPTLVDAEAAGVAVGRAPNTIHWWAHRRWLTKHGGRRRRLYDLTEIHDVARTIDRGDQPPTVR